jgi:hypothetical protein
VACALAGAVGCIIVNNRQDMPISMGGGTYGGNATIPVMMLHQNDGAILKNYINQPGGLWVTVGADPEMILGEANVQGGRGTADTWFYFGIPHPAGLQPGRRRL